jgi:pimeloyl-ACP methyl ester carboxylesterase
MSEQPTAHTEISGSGKTVLLLHGWGSSAELMKPIAGKLSKKHRCVAVDFPGHGSTPEPPEPWGPEEYVAWTLALMDRLEIESADVIGHSHGGRVAIGLAALHPERVDKLVLAASSGLRSRQNAKARVRVRMFKSGRYMAKSPLLPTSAKKKLQGWVDRQGSDDYRAASGLMRSTLVKLVNSDARQLLPRLQCPTLLIWGDKDDQTPLANAREMERLIPDAGLVVLGGGGHFVYAEQLDHFCRVVDNFLAAA